MDPSAENGGYLGDAALAELQESYRTALTGLGLGEVSPVVRDGKDFVLLQWLTPDEENWLKVKSAALSVVV